MQADALDQKRRELAALTEQLNAQLHQGLVSRMQHPSWYLTGVQVGLESLQAYYEISELVYRDHTSRSEGGRRLGNLRNVYARLTEFARGGMSPAQRAELMLGIRHPLQTLLREFRGWETAEEAVRQRKTIISQLAVDIRMSLLKLRGFEKMNQDLSGLLSPMYWLAGGAKRKAAERIRYDHIGYANEFGFGNPDVLLNSKIVKQTQLKVGREIKKLERAIQTVHEKIYRDRYSQRATEDIKTDLSETRTVPLLQEISKAGFEYLDRAATAYEHALQLVNGDMRLLQRVTLVDAEIDEIELALLSRDSSR